LHEPSGIILRKGANFRKDVDAKKRRTDWQALSQVQRHHLLVANAHKQLVIGGAYSRGKAYHGKDQQEQQEHTEHNKCTSLPAPSRRGTMLDTRMTTTTSPVDVVPDNHTVLPLESIVKADYPQKISISLNVLIAALWLRVGYLAFRGNQI
jgi:hypothetical protein